MDFRNHHAHLIEGVSVETVSLVCSEIERQFDMLVSGNPDVWQKHTDAFGIEDSRELRDFSLLKPVGGHKCCIVSFRTISIEAQNALLKVLEEPTPNTSFFVVAPSQETLLPTLRSRLALETMGGVIARESSVTPEFFLSSDKSKRLDMLSGIVKEKDAPETLVFLNGIELALYSLFKEDNTNGDLLFALQEVSRAHRFLQGRSSSIKLILEDIALVLPVL